MALYRTKPETVEATQFTGNTNDPFSGGAPQWVWSALGSGKLRFTPHGIEIVYAGMMENVSPTDWIVLHNDGIIRACDDKVFRAYYTRSRLANGTRVTEKNNAHI